MHVAALLSDLTALRASDPDAALGLLTPSNPSTDASSKSSTAPSTASSTTEDADLHRARRLMSLHREFRGTTTTTTMNYDGGDAQAGQAVKAKLDQARREVEAAMGKLDGRGS